MLQKIYWLNHFQSEHIKFEQEFRTFFCKHEFPHQTFVSPAFAIVRGGLVSNAYAWTLVVNNNSIFIGEGSVITPVDEVVEQIRRLMILRINIFFSNLPEEVEKYCGNLHSVGSNLVPRKILPDVFSNESRLFYEEIESLGSWIQKVLSLSRQNYRTVCQALAAYERALHVLSSDPALSYSLLVFAIESLANSHSDYYASWDDVPDQQKNCFNILFEDDRGSSIDAGWIDDLRKALVGILHPWF